MSMISINRRVFHLSGYDPMTPAAYHKRFVRELRRFETCWGVKASSRDFAETETSASWTVTVTGADWSVTSQHDLLRWDDVIARHRSNGVLQRWWDGILAFADFTRHGALVAYLRVAWRYAVFFLYPFAVMTALVLAGWLGSRIVNAAGLPLPVALVGGASLTLFCIIRLVSRTHVGHLLDDWSFATRIARDVNPVIAPRIKTMADKMLSTPETTPCLVVGHSLGAVLAIDMLDEALKHSPGARRLGFLTLGSSILKIALHRKAHGLRARVANVATSQQVDWAEYQALNDVMNFYRSEPVTALGLGGKAPVVRLVRFRSMLAPAYYKSIKRNFFRLHCQFISGNDLRSRYDYLMTICGPFELMALVRSPDGAQSWIGEDGSLAGGASGALLPTAPVSLSAKDKDQP